MPQSTQIILIIVLGLLIVFSALFSAAETAYSSVNIAKVNSDFKKGKKAAVLIKKHYKSFGWTLSTILICNNLVNILAATLITMLFNSIFSSDSMTMLVSTCVMTPIIVAFGEITPKLLAKKYSYGYLKKVAYAMEVLNYVLFPITYPLSKITLGTQVTNTEKDLKNIISIAKEEGVLEKQEATLAQNALDLDSTNIGTIMVKREDIKIIKLGSSIKDAEKIFKSTGHSRLPVISGNKFVGVIILKDIIFKKTGTIDEYVKDAPYMSRNTIATKGLRKLRINGSHIGFVTKTNNSKQVIGIVTLEDIIEELVGEIYDEHDTKLPIREVGLYIYYANGSASMSDIEKELDFEFEGSKDLTLKQWIQSRITRNVKTGLKYIYKDKFTFKIVSNKQGKDASIEIIIK